MICPCSATRARSSHEDGSVGTIDTGLRRRDVQLTARNTSNSGDTRLTGVQAIARLLVEQHEHDQRAGGATANFISGDQGSPFGGLDRLLGSMPGVLQASNTTFVPGLNEELAATAVWGSAISSTCFPRRRSVRFAWHLSRICPAGTKRSSSATLLHSVMPSNTTECLLGASGHSWTSSSMSSSTCSSVVSNEHMRRYVSGSDGQA